MHKNVETLIGRLATDPSLRHRFAANPRGVLEDFALRGLELTVVELDALASLDPSALGAFASVLDRRLQRAATATTSAGADR